jgi:ParB family chromosome partitioning protein
MNVKSIPVNEILEDEDFNCRGHIAPIDIKTLAEDIKKVGLMQPVVVVELDEINPARLVQGKKYKLVAGFRRYNSYKYLFKNEEDNSHWSEIMANVIENMDDVQLRIMNLKENIHREDLTFQQEAEAVKRLLDLGESEKNIYEALGKTRGWAQIRCQYLKLPVDIQKEYDSGNITQPQIRELNSFRVRVEKGEADQSDLYEAVRKMKDQKVRGVSKPVRPKTKNLKCQRKKAEIESLQNHLYRMQDNSNSVINRALAWAAGFIGTDDLNDSLRKYCDEEGYDYRPFDEDA